MNATNSYYIKVDVLFTDSSVVDEIDSIALQHFNSCGVVDFSIDEPKVDEILGERAFSGGDVSEAVLDEVSSTVQGEDLWRSYYFYQEHDEEANLFAAYLCENYEDLAVRLHQLDVEDWNIEWRKNYKPIAVSENLKVIPQWMKDNFPESGDKKMLYIYPGQGFGTGGHETTFLCLKIFDRLMSENAQLKNCLDLGCGSGILGIAAIKYKFEHVSFCDIDKSALDNCVQNLVLNFENQDLSNHLVVDRKRLQSGKKYDLVFANILESALIEESELICGSVDQGGIIILSGILKYQADNMKLFFSKLGFVCFSELSMGDWSALGMKKE